MKINSLYKSIKSKLYLNENQKKEFNKYQEIARLIYNSSLKQYGSDNDRELYENGCKVIKSYSIELIACSYLSQFLFICLRNNLTFKKIDKRVADKIKEKLNSDLDLRDKSNLYFLRNSIDFGFSIDKTQENKLRKNKEFKNIKKFEFHKNEYKYELSNLFLNPKNYKGKTQKLNFFSQEKEFNNEIKTRNTDLTKISSKVISEILKAVEKANKKYSGKIYGIHQYNLKDLDKMESIKFLVPKKCKPLFKNSNDSVLYKESYRDLNRCSLNNLNSSLNPESGYGYIKSLKAQGDEAINLGYLKFRKYKNFNPNRVREFSITQENNEYFISILIEMSPPPIKNTNHNIKAIGIDYGVVNNMTLCFEDNKGKKTFEVRNFNHLAKIERLEKRVKILQKQLSRKQAGNKKEEIAQSNNYKKQRIFISKLQSKISRIKDYEIKLIVCELTKNYPNCTIGIENLNIQNMTASAKGTIEKSGSHVAQKSGLNRNILAQNWGKSRAWLKTKASLYNSTVVEINKNYTSQGCSCCGHISSENRKNQSDFKCVKCGHTQNADENASVNILNLALNKIKLVNKKEILIFTKV